MAVLSTEKILTLDYWKAARHIEVGDYLFDRKGNIVKVKLVQHYMASACYTVHLNDHLTLSGDSNLSFLLETKKYRDRVHAYKGHFKFKRPLLLSKLSEILNKPLKNKYGKLAFSIPTCEPLKFPTQPLPVPPFILGYWLINRNGHNHMTVYKKYEDYVVSKFKSFGYEVIIRKRGEPNHKYMTVLPSIESQLAPKIPTMIPNNYLLGDEEQRLELLSGIMHAKDRQYNAAKDTFRFTTKSNAEMRQIQGLIESLGCKTNSSFRNDFKEYTIIFRSKLKIMENQASPPIKIHQTRRYLREIEEIKPQMCVHIETDGPDGSFLVGEGFIACR